MCRGLIGRKLGMSGIFTRNGRYLPVTVLRVGPCVVTQIKKSARDGYTALQLGFSEKKSRKTTKPLQGHFRKSGKGCFYLTREFGVDNPDEFEVGQVLGPDIFKVGEKVDVRGTSKGRGFSGVMKRYGFSGGRKTHGSKSHRVPGSIGCSAWPGRVIKGKKMPGRYGAESKTVRNLEVIDIRSDESIILLKGAVPGHRLGNVLISKVKFIK